MSVRDVQNYDYYRSPFLSPAPTALVPLTPAPGLQRSNSEEGFYLDEEAVDEGAVDEENDPEGGTTEYGTSMVQPANTLPPRTTSFLREPFVEPQTYVQNPQALGTAQNIEMQAMMQATALYQQQMGSWNYYQNQGVLQHQQQMGSRSYYQSRQDQSVSQIARSNFPAITTQPQGEETDVEEDSDSTYDEPPPNFPAITTQPQGEKRAIEEDDDETDSDSTYNEPPQKRHCSRSTVCSRPAKRSTDYSELAERYQWTKKRHACFLRTLKKLPRASHTPKEMIEELNRRLRKKRLPEVNKEQLKSHLQKYRSVTGTPSVRGSISRYGAYTAIKGEGNRKFCLVPVDELTDEQKRKRKK